MVRPSHGTSAEDEAMGPLAVATRSDRWPRVGGIPVRWVLPRIGNDYSCEHIIEKNSYITAVATKK